MQAIAKVVLVVVTMVMAIAEVVLVLLTMMAAVAGIVMMLLTLVLVFHVPKVVMQVSKVVAVHIVCLGSMVKPPQVSTMLKPPEQWRNYVQAILMAQ